MIYHVRLILHAADNTPCCDTPSPLDSDVSLVWIYKPGVATPGDNGPFPCKHGKSAIIKTCTLEVPGIETVSLPDDREPKS
jgi:hypothetical protein